MPATRKASFGLNSCGQASFLNEHVTWLGFRSLAPGYLSVGKNVSYIPAHASKHVIAGSCDSLDGRCVKELFPLQVEDEAAW